MLWGVIMKNMNRSLIALFLLVGLSAPVQAEWSDLFSSRNLAIAALAAGTGYVYMNIDSNETLLKKADQYFQEIDTCQDVMVPVSWQGTREQYFEQYLHNQFGIKPNQVHKDSAHTYTMVSDYVKSMQLQADLARNCVSFRSTFFAAMHEKYTQILGIDHLLQSALMYAKNYDNFLLGYQIINFHAKLPTNDKHWLAHSNLQEQQLALTKFIRRGYFGQNRYPLISYAQEFSAHLNYIRSNFANHNFATWYPILSAQLENCQDSLENALDLLLDSAAYHKEKEIQHQEELIRVEQEKARALQEQARAQRDQAAAQRDQAWAQHNQAWAQHRKAAAQEKANEIEKRK